MDWDLFDGKSRWIYQNESVYFGWKWEKIRSELTDIKFCIREIAQLAELDQERRMRLHRRLSVARKRHIQPLFFPEPARLVMWSTGTIGAAWSKLIQEYTSTETQGFCKSVMLLLREPLMGGRDGLIALMPVRQKLTGADDARVDRTRLPMAR